MKGYFILASSTEYYMAALLRDQYLLNKAGVDIKTKVVSRKENLHTIFVKKQQNTFPFEKQYVHLHHKN